MMSKERKSQVIHALKVNQWLPEWLTKSDGHPVYRETRTQELVDLLWTHEESPWHHRINMLGGRGYTGLQATQASWIRSLLASFIKSYEGRRVVICNAEPGQYGLIASQSCIMVCYSDDSDQHFTGDQPGDGSWPATEVLDGYTAVDTPDLEALSPDPEALSLIPNARVWL